MPQPYQLPNAVIREKNTLLVLGVVDENVLITEIKFWKHISPP